MQDLLTGATSHLGRIGPPTEMTTDGRYVFAAGNQGLEILDSGVWTWDHRDHFHYYRSEPRKLGVLAAGGKPTVSTGMLSTAGSTGVFFPSSGAAVLLDNAALSDGRISEVLRLNVEPHAGLMAPLGSGAIITESDDGGPAMRLRAIDAAGHGQATAQCPAAAGTITTRVGLVVGCADGAVIATADADVPVLEHIPYPEGATGHAVRFDGRKGRPTVAGIGAGSGAGTGVWLLDSRERQWDWLPTASAVVAAAAVDDAAAHVVVVAADGTVEVYDAATEERVAVTEPLLAGSLSEPALAGRITLTVDAQRAYVNAPAEGVVYEIDYADNARIARTLELPTNPDYLAETGR